MEDNKEKKKINILQKPSVPMDSKPMEITTREANIVVLTQAGAKGVSNIIEIAFIETSRLLKRVKEYPTGLNAAEQKAVFGYAETLIKFSKEEREARLQNQLGALTDEEIMNLASDAAKYLEGKKKK